MDTTKELSHISLCTGYGGIDLGLGRALGAVRTISYVEIEAFPIINLVKKIEAGLMDSAPIFTDLKAFPWGLYRHKVDILSGGFPCQPFSAAGRRAGDEDPRHLWPYIVRGIRELGRPPLVFFENVEGIISSKLKGDNWRDPEGTSVLLHVLRELERLGYSSTAGVFSAAEVGAPHQRKRVFILGVRDDLRQSGLDLVSTFLNQGSLVNSYNSRDNPSRDDIDTDREEALQGRKKLPQLKSCRSSTAYPKGKGEDQHPWEPPRVTLGNSKHNGLSTASERRSTQEASDGCEKGEKAPSKLKGASEPKLCTDLQGSILEHTNSGTATERQRRFNSIFSKSIKQEETDRCTRSSNSFRSRGEVESSMGGDSYGASDRLDFAKLSESCDSRIDELRMLGNGVVPDTAARAFRVLFNRLSKSHV